MTVPDLRRTLHIAGHFLARGPAYHARYARWHLARIRQRLLPVTYSQEGSPNNGEYTRRAGDAAQFFFGPDDVGDIIAAIDADERRATIDDAERICRNEFTYRHTGPIRFDGEIDWFCAPGGNKDWRWDLNRHTCLETLGFAWHYTRDRRYADKFAGLIADWLDKNPPGVTQPNWASPFEVGFRINSWTWAYHLFRHCPAVAETTLARLLAGLEAHAVFLDRNLETHARNNHLLLEAKALLAAALLFPDFRDSARRFRRAERLLIHEIRHQVHEDGVHGELSTHYHKVIAGELLEIVLLYRLNDRRLPADIESRIRGMVEFEICVARPDGLLPLFGDSSQTDSYARFSALRAGPRLFDIDIPASAAAAPTERDIWRLAHAQRRPGQPDTDAGSRAFPEGGYYVMKHGRAPENATYLCIDSGPFGLRADPHHGHADALSFELFAGGRPWLVDSGVYSTHTSWEWRRYFRGTRSHNTVCIDGEDQTVLLDSRRVLRQARCRCRRWLTGRAVDHFDGEHDGYARLLAPVSHRRMVWFVRGEYWLVVDVLTGKGRHAVEYLYHAPADVSIALPTEENEARFSCALPGSELRLAVVSSAPLAREVIRGATSPIQGWRSTHSGRKDEAPTLSLRQTAVMPTMCATVFCPHAGGGEVETLSPALLDDNAVDGSVVALSVSRAAQTDYFLSALSEAGGERRLGPFTTDAMLAVIRDTPSGASVLFASGGSVRDRDGQPLPQVEGSTGRGQSD